MEKATQVQTREHNRGLVLHTIFQHDPVSRAEIARLTGLTRTTVSDIVGMLIEKGLVSEIGLGDSQGGKLPILLSLVENSRYLIALDLAQSELRGAIVNLRGKIHASLSLPAEDLCGDEALRQVVAMVDELMSLAPQPVLGIGVGTPGLVNSKTGVVIRAVNLDWENLPLADLLSQRCHLPVKVLNDSQAAALGEYTYGRSYPAESNLIVVNARQGVGAGIILHGRLFPGDGGGAGEIGHTVVVHHDGGLCRCGNRGCLETVASAKALVRQVGELAGQPGAGRVLPGPDGKITLEAIRQAFQSGEPHIQKLVLDSGHWMGVGISTLVGILNIRRIVLSGDMTCFGSPWLEAIRAGVEHNALPGQVKDTQVEIGQVGKDSVLLGASAILANDYSLLYSPNILENGFLS